MAVNIIKEPCIACGSCINACPFGAINMEADKAVINAACTACGACIDICPVGAIVRETEVKKIVANKEAYKGVWVYLEQVEGQAKSVGYELLGQGRKLADIMNEELAAVVIGNNISHLSQEAFASGADRVFLIEGEDYHNYNTDAYTSALTDVINTYKPSVILLGATNDGRDLAPRVACRIGTGLTADCTDLGIDEETGLVAWTRPAFGGNIMATILCPDHRPQMGTVRPKVFKRPAVDNARTGEVVRFAANLKSEDIRTKLIEVIKVCNNSCNLEEAEIIVSGGRGVGKPDNFMLIEELAAVLGGAVGASRAVVDAGWKPAMHQIGQTGKTVGPKIYFACGISGAIQHMAGVSSSDIIIAINKDKDAPIFKVADFGIIGDVTEVIPALIEEFKKIKNQ